MTLADNKVTLVSIRSVGQQTEQAFLDLVEKEEFARLRPDLSERRGRVNRDGEPRPCDAIACRQEPRHDQPLAALLGRLPGRLPQTLRSWVYRVWVLVSVLAAVGYLLYRFGAVPRGRHRAAGLATSSATCCAGSLLGSVTLIIVLTAGSISSERGTMADSVLSRGISRYQYFLGKWHARLATVLGTFFAMGVVALLGQLFPAARRPVARRAAWWRC